MEPVRSGVGRLADLPGGKERDVCPQRRARRWRKGLLRGSWWRDGRPGLRHQLVTVAGTARGAGPTRSTLAWPWRPRGRRVGGWVSPTLLPQAAPRARACAGLEGPTLSEAVPDPLLPLPLQRLGSREGGRTSFLAFSRVLRRLAYVGSFVPSFTGWPVLGTLLTPMASESSPAEWG